MSKEDTKKKFEGNNTKELNDDFIQEIDSVTLKEIELLLIKGENKVAIDKITKKMTIFKAKYGN